MAKTGRRQNQGASKTRLYLLYRAIIQRCEDKNCAAFHHYGGRGIVITKLWRKSFAAFKNWSYKNGYDETKSIDRINPDGNYSHLNCRWIGRSLQARNRRDTVWIWSEKEKRCLAEWAEITGINKGTLYSRVKLGLKSSEIFRTPKKNASPATVKFRGARRTLTELSALTGIKRSTLSHRYYSGARGDSLVAPLQQGIKIN